MPQVKSSKNSLDLEVLHALVVEHLPGHPPLRRPVEEHVHEQEERGRDVEPREALPTHLVLGGLSDEEVEADGDRGDRGEPPEDVDRVVAEPLAVSDPREDRLGVDKTFLKCPKI